MTDAAPKPPPGSNRRRLVLLCALLLGAAAFLLAGGHRLLSFELLVERKDDLVALAGAHPILAPASWAAAYLAIGLFGLPGSTVLNLAAGVLFGFAEGIVLVVSVSTVASSAAFLSFRYLLFDFVEERAKRRFPAAVAELEREGLYFVFTLRLLPVIPWSATNLLVAVSPVPFWPCVGISLAALMPRFLLYVYAGTNLGGLKSPGDLWSPKVLAVLAVLAVVPWLVHRSLPLAKRLLRRT